MFKIVVAPDNLLQKQNGQTLIIIILVSLLALGMGLTISSRFIKTFRSHITTDSSSRALAVAEAAIENMLLKPQTTLEGYINYNNCGSNCYYEIVGVDGVKASATIKLSFVGNSSDAYKLSLKTNESGEVSMAGYPNNQNVSVCWNSSSGNYPSIKALFFYGSAGSYAVDNYAYNSVGSSNSDNGFSTVSSGGGYNSCFTVIGKQTPQTLRVSSIYGDADVYIVPSVGASIPEQGILIEADGVVSDITRKIKVIKSATYLPTQFDYILYQKSKTDPLSN